MTADYETPGHTMDTHHGHTMDTQVTGHHGHGRVGLYTHPGPVSPRQDVLETLGYHRPQWQRDALCREYPNLPWFPKRGESAKPALQVCGRCMVLVECRAWAMADQSLDAAGVLGGMSAIARIRARRLQQRRATP